MMMMTGLYHCNHTESPTKEPVNSLSLGDEHLDTISATESDEFIKSSVENLVPTPIEFEDFSDDECDLPPYDDSSKNHDFTFSNPLFDIDEDFTLSDESFSEEDIPKENFIIFSNPLFDLDERNFDLILSDAESDLVESCYIKTFRLILLLRIDSLSIVCSTITLLLDLRKLFKPISNAIESIPPSHIPVADKMSYEEIDLILADDGIMPPVLEE
ncbi:hypothetical protein Tco_1482134 [Tanacetum coccineum]